MDSFTPILTGEDYDFQGELDELFGDALSGNVDMSGMDGDDLFGDNALEADVPQALGSPEFATSGPSFLLEQSLPFPQLTFPTLPEQPVPAQEEQDSMFSPTHMYPESLLSDRPPPITVPLPIRAPAPKRVSPQRQAATQRRARARARARAPTPAASLAMPTYLGQAPNTLAQDQSFTDFQSFDFNNDDLLMGFNQPPMRAPAPLVAPSPAVPVVLDGKKLTHNRNHKYQDNDPDSVYVKPVGLRAWGPMTQERIPQSMFEYNNSSAELLPFKSYSKDELITFFTSFKDHPSPSRNLTLWVQNTPAQSNNRYAMGPSSGKCRYKNCVTPQKTILKGFFRIAFDEFSHLTGTSLDPFHNAGYMHLHCFEELFDLGYLIHYGAVYYNFRIRADTRNFPYETRNPMSLNRDHPGMSRAYNEWVQSQKPRCDQLYQANLRNPGCYDGFHRVKRTPHNHRLGYRLTIQHLAYEVKGRASARDARGGAHIGKHKGDLNLYVQLRRAEHTAKKRKRGGDDDEDEEDEEEVQITAVVPRRRQRQGDTIVVGSGGPSRPPPLGLSIPPSTPIAQTLPETPSQVPRTPVGPRTRQFSRQLESTFVDFLNSRSHLTRRETQEIQTALGDAPEHVQENVLSAVEPAVANLFAPRNSVGSGEQVTVEKRLGKLSKRQRRDVEKFVERLENKGRFHSLY